MGLHMPELIIVLVAALLIFGPKKLPEMGSAIGQSVKAFRKGISEISNPTNAELLAPMPKDALPDEDVNSQTNTSFTNKAANAEEHAD